MEPLMAPAGARGVVTKGAACCPKANIPLINETASPALDGHERPPLAEVGHTALRQSVPHGMRLGTSGSLTTHGVVFLTCSCRLGLSASLEGGDCRFVCQRTLLPMAACVSSSSAPPCD